MDVVAQTLNCPELGSHEEVQLSLHELNCLKILVVSSVGE